MLHNWSSAVLIALTEILDRLSRQTDKIQSASLSMQFGAVSSTTFTLLIIRIIIVFILSSRSEQRKFTSATGRVREETK